MSLSAEARVQLYTAAEKVDAAVSEANTGLDKFGEAADFLRQAEDKVTEGLGYLALAGERLKSAAGSYAPASAAASEASDETKVTLAGYVNLQEAEYVTTGTAAVAGYMEDAKQACTTLNTSLQSRLEVLTDLVESLGDTNNEMITSQGQMRLAHALAAEVPIRTRNIADRL